MGALQASEMAALADTDTALMWHLQHNHFPAVPLSMLPVCKDAIELANNGESERSVTLPDGTTWRGQDAAPAWAIIEAHHLEPWLDQ